MAQQTKRLYEFGAFRLDADNRQLWRGTQIVPLKPKVFETLLVLVEHHGRVLEREELIEKLWPDSFVEEANLNVNISAIRKALGVGPNDRDYIVTVPGRGYRFAAEVNRVGGNDTETRRHGDTEQEPAESSEVAVAAAPRHRVTASRVAVALALAVALAVAAYWWLRQRVNQRAAATTVHSLAVLPFRALNAEGSNEYLGLGMSDALITRMSNVRQVIVRPTSAVRKYAGQEPDPQTIGRELQVDAVLEGSIQTVGERVRVTVQLVSVGENRHLWGETFDEKFTDMLALEDSISERVADALALRLSGSERARLAKHYTDNPEAYQLYLKGRYHAGKVTKEGFDKSIAYFNQAITLDPKYALAYEGLAFAYSLSGDVLLPAKEAMPKAGEAARRALALDDTIAEAHSDLGLVHFWYDWDWPGAERELQRAIELNPNQVTTHNWYAFFLTCMGRFDEAMAENKRAQEIDPLHSDLELELGLNAYLARHYDEAIAHLRSAIEIEPNHWPPYANLGRAYEAKGAPNEAIAALVRARQIEADVPEILGNLGHVYAAAGQRAEAARILAELQSAGRRGYVEPYNVALVYAGLGDKEQAFAWLEKAFAERSFYITWLKVDPELDGLRGDRRFADLLRRAGLAE
ncbi:MAG TPA: winged helix-turn-helix domain-containing protein [Blastocatellia bacterium]|nr:winged helix-turn-helix domain-containing protein [Blastocatellia bacterium]